MRYVPEHLSNDHRNTTRWQNASRYQTRNVTLSDSSTLKQKRNPQDYASDLRGPVRMRPRASVYKQNYF